MTIYLRYLAIFAVVISLQGCKFKDLEFKGIDNYKIEQFSMKGIKLNLGVKLENPNWFAIKAKGGEINVKANGIKLGVFNITKAVKIPKKSDGVVNVGIEAKTKNIIGTSLLSLMSIATKGGKVKLEVDGYIHAGAFGISKKVKVSTTEYIGL